MDQYFQRPMGSRWNRCDGRMTSRCCLTPETIFPGTSSAEMPPNHRLLSGQSCEGSGTRRGMQTGLAVTHERKSPASAVLHKQNSRTSECQLLCACPARRPVLGGQIGINLGRMGRGGGHSRGGGAPSRSREGSCGMAERSGGLVFAALMKTSGSFRSEIRHRAREFSSQPSAGLHNSEEPSRGNAIMRRCRSERRDRMLQRLPGRGPRRALVSLTL